MSPQSSWTVDPDSLAAFAAGLEAESSPAWFRLRAEAERLALRPSFDRLITLDHNTIKELPHQIKVAEQALRRPMAGRAILADEVGLGKTIEAGIILKELAVRGLARRVLVLTPAALVEQWQAELETKFFEIFDTPRRPADWRKANKAIVSHSRARSVKHQAEILARRWDLLIVDEAHKAKRHNTRLYQLLQQIERNFVLLLTATPLQNDLRELYNLITLLRPGQLGTWPEFKDRYVRGGDIRQVRGAEGLRELTAEVMIRTRRANVSDSVSLPPRTPVHPDVRLSDDEATLYRDMVRFLRELYRRGFYETSEAERREDRSRKRRRAAKGIHALERMRLCQRLCSSSHALAYSLRKIADGDAIRPEFRARAIALAESARAVDRHAKLEALTQLLHETHDRILVFSEHLPTVKLIVHRVREMGRPVREFSGRVSRRQRSRHLATFKHVDDAVLVATRAGTEGLNLQFCNRMVNYELPWNPMQVEQRIGRIHRIGQTRETFIVNLAAAGTIEDRVLQLLHDKIRLFELVVGELDVILGEFGGAETLEKRLVDAWLDAEDDDGFETSFDEIGRAIEESRVSGLEQERLNSEMVAADEAMRVVEEFSSLSVPGRIRLAYGTRQLTLAPGLEAKRQRIGLHVAEILDMLAGSPVVEVAPAHADYGPVRTIVGLTGRLRAVGMTAQCDRLPMTLIDLWADEEAPLLPN